MKQDPVKTLNCFIKATNGRPFEPYIGGGLTDKQGHYRWEPVHDFPFSINLFCFSTGLPERPLTWHEYLELFIPLENHCRFQMGRTVVSLQAGDLLVVDNSKLHVVLDFPGSEMRALVIRFLPDFIYSLGSFSIDHLFCVPFYHQVEGQPHVLREADPAALRVHAALLQLLECYFGQDDPPYSQAGTKVLFLEVLYHLARHFHVAGLLHADYVQRQQRSLQLRKLFDYASCHFAEPISLEQAAVIVGMSRNRFANAFKEVAGMTWVDYLKQVRLINAARLLKETCLSVAEIAAFVGYADQSYFDRRFKERFSQSPLRFRMGARQASRRPVEPHH